MGAARRPSNRLSIMAKKKKNTGIPYEKLVQGIFQAIHDQEEVAPITVQQNKTLQGKISTHQIDVYWKFQTGGIEHEVIVRPKIGGTRLSRGTFSISNVFSMICSAANAIGAKDARRSIPR